jgi:hypothetical protein
LATFRDLEAYLKRDDWVAEPNLTRGRRRTGDHRRYRKELPDGTVLRTKVSHALGDEIGTDLFKHILRAQLRVDEAAFWVVVRGGGQRTAEVRSPRPGTVPAWLVQRLLYTVGLPEADVRKLTAEEAIELWEAFISRPTSS